jgi:hypothetical protein
MSDILITIMRLSPRSFTATIKLLSPFLACLAMVFGSIRAQDTPVNVAFDALWAGQYNVGFKAVDDYITPLFTGLYYTGYFGDAIPKNYYGPVDSNGLPDYTVPNAGTYAVTNYEYQKAPPAILGPDGEHLLDNHHRITGLNKLYNLYTNGSLTNTNTLGVVPGTVYVSNITNWSSYTTNEFWTAMEQGNTGGVTNFVSMPGFTNTTNQPTYIWQFNEGVSQNPLVTPPPRVSNLTDDTLRSIAGSLAQGETNGLFPRPAGYLERGADNDVLYYQEFYWANYLRPLVYWDTTNSTFGQDTNALYRFTNYDELCLFAATNLCLQPQASSLPGFVGAVPEPSSTALLILGLALLVLLVRHNVNRAKDSKSSGKNY